MCEVDETLVPYVPAYLVTIVLYDGVLKLENVVYAIEPFVPVRGASLWDAGLLDPTTCLPSARQ